MQSQKRQCDLCSFPKKTLQYHSNSSLCPTTNAEEVEDYLHDPDNHDGVINQLESYILKFEVKWALGSITTNKASAGDGIPVELFQILKDDAVKALHSIYQQIWKIQQWPQEGKRSVFIPIPKKEMKYMRINDQIDSSRRKR